MMADVVDFTQAKENLTPHMSGEARCLDCKHEWIAVAPIGTVWLECPSCSLTRGRMKFQHERGSEDHWNCHCGNDLFHVTPDGVYCPNCGIWQTGL